ncbi:MAG TPA: aminoglycoside phosphotransferase family protein [Herpetosiphonaceae bacterium]
MSHEPGTVAEALRRRIGPQITIAEARRLSVGFGHAAWYLRTVEQGAFLLKIATRQPTDYYFANEIHAQQRMLQHGQPVPEIVAVCHAPNELGQHFYIQRWIPGEDGTTAVAAMSARQRSAFACDFGRAVALMHRIEGAAFSEDALGENVLPSWRDLCATRLSDLIRSNVQAAVLPPDRLAIVEERCARMIAELASDIAPVFTHRDLYLPNTLVHEGRFKTVIDFESVRFYDGLWDFVKLYAWVFRHYPEMEAPFLAGYRSAQPWPADAARRILLYQGLEYLAALPYFARQYPSPDRLREFQGLMAQWLSERAVSSMG